MTKSIQFTENIKLSEKLASYIAKNPSIKFGGTVSFVVFSAQDNELNKKNLDLAKSLKQKGGTIIKAQETENPRKPWVFSRFVISK